mgnify:CR=1 FL=1
MNKVSWYHTNADNGGFFSFKCCFSLAISSSSICGGLERPSTSTSTLHAVAGRSHQLVDYTMHFILLNLTKSHSPVHGFAGNTLCLVLLNIFTRFHSPVRGLVGNTLRLVLLNIFTIFHSPVRGLVGHTLRLVLLDLVVDGER